MKIMSSKGFTLLEIIIAIAILVIGIVGISTVFSRISILTSGISNRLVAAYLAQEGIEIVRNIRDTNWVEEAGNWKEGLTDGDWEADYQTQGSLNDDYDSDFLNIDGSTGFYSYSAGTQTKYKRRITITSDGEDVLIVSVLIEWEEKGNPYDFGAEEYIYDYL